MVRDGYFYGLGFLAAAAAAVLLTHDLIWAVIPLLAAAFFLWFFRNPRRVIPTGPGLVVSPGDGKVTEVTRIDTPDGPLQRISIFLSVFNVHVNRSPIAGQITSVRYRKGLYLNAMNPKSAVENEQNIVTVQGDGYSVTFKQIAGLIARRIIFHYKEGDIVSRGQLVGLIKFGSRVDVELPANATVSVRVGQTVKGGSSVLASLPPAVQG